MKNTRIVILYYKLSFLILFLLLKSALLLATEDVIYNLKFKQLSAPYFLPTNEVQKVYQDKDWIYKEWSHSHYTGKVHYE